MLLHKDAMKKPNTRINFANDKIHIFDVATPVYFSSPRHYCIPIDKLDYQNIYNDLNR